MSGDNKELNTALGFVRGFSANKSCRICRIDIEDIVKEATSCCELRRTKENYDDDVLMNNFTATGVREYSIFNEIPFFHVTTSAGVNTTHDMSEG
ncbi:hypothetical protein Bhyg_03218 [Pseudolycoriella hygida]|uniref:Uncharacterized protein n=1 Tax=Pseudolycoriella hygida TaxID=35572 RepID=A0A9Q0S8I9_9DIPT|nr:hypothetical protein Bhyg_03218 [Pseudolycoriella hygida]